MGQAIDSGDGWPGTNSTNWTNLTTYVNNQKTSIYTNLQNWYLSGGIMVWIYRSDGTPPTTNSYLLTYNNNVKTNH